jgi:uncharacterized protein (TIGR00251 family)
VFDILQASPPSILRLSAARDGWSAAIEARVRVRLTPRASRDEIAGWQDGVLRVRVSAPPIEGRANAALERLLAEALGVPKSAVRVSSGARSREKLVSIAGLDDIEVRRRLGAPTLV